MKSDIIKVMGGKRASREDFGSDVSARARYIDGKQVTPREWVRHLSETRAERAAKVQEEIEEDWAAEMDNRDIRYAGDVPTKRSQKVKLRCGCDRKAEFTATIYQLERLDRNCTCCPMCFEQDKNDALKTIVEAKGGTLLTRYSGVHEKVKVDCGRGHKFFAEPGNLMRGNGANGSWCSACRKESGKHRLREVLAERGCTLVADQPSSTLVPKTFLDFNGVETTKHYSQLVTHPPICGPSRGKRRVRMFYCDNTMECFAILHEVPPLLPNRIAKIVEKNDFEEMMCVANLEGSYNILKQAILNENEFGDYRCLNVNFNPQWLAPGRYTWGEIDPFHDTLVRM